MVCGRKANAFVGHENESVCDVNLALNADLENNRSQFQNIII